MSRAGARPSGSQGGLPGGSAYSTISSVIYFGQAVMQNLRSAAEGCQDIYNGGGAGYTAGHPPLFTGPSQPVTPAPQPKFAFSRMRLGSHLGNLSRLSSFRHSRFSCTFTTLWSWGQYLRVYTQGEVLGYAPLIKFALMPASSSLVIVSSLSLVPLCFFCALCCSSSLFLLCVFHRWFQDHKCFHFSPFGP